MAARVDPFGGLAGKDRDAYAAMLGVLKSYGLESLAPTVMGYLKNGYTEDTITVLLPTTPEYKKRFSANEARKAKGLPVLSPAEYLATEQTYRQIMSSAGLPPGYYDKPDDFKKFMENDVSPSEVQARVKSAHDLVDKLPVEARTAFGDMYTKGDLVAYALDPHRAAPLIDEQIRAARAAGAGRVSGFDLTKSQAETVAKSDIADEQIAGGVATASRYASSTGTLAEIYGGQYTADDALSEVFRDNGSAQQVRRKLASQERATFAGSANTDTRSLSRRDAGRI